MSRIVGVAAFLILIGAGCTAVTPELQKKSSIPPESVGSPNTILTPEKDDEEENKPAEELTLEAEALGSGQVKFSWTAPSGLTEANRFILVQGTEENPVHDGKHNWYRQYYANRAVIWSNLSSGPHHFRICLTENNDQDTCTIYSNDVELEVK